MRNYFKLSLLLLYLLSACNFTRPGQPIVPETAPAYGTGTPFQGYASPECAFIWAREPLRDLSRDFKKALEDIQPQANGYAEAYGENCINNRGEVVRFLAMETDFYVTVMVRDLEDKRALGEMIEQVLGVVSQFPVEETPGPQPGYVGITFEAPEDELRLWFTQLEAQAVIDTGLQGEELFYALQAK